MANNIDNKLNKINNFTTLSQADRYSYTEDYNAVRDYVIEKLRDIDPFFNKIFKGSRLCGSYADRVKISKPNEYDVNFHLKLRNYKLAIISPDPNKPGYVLINVTDILKTIKGESHNREIYERLMKFVDDQGYLLQNRIFSWFEGLMTKIFVNYGKTFTKNNKVYILNYRKSGPAHTIRVHQNDREIDIDFVPAFVFDKSQWIAERPCPDWIQDSDWTAIPKPDCKGNNIGFRASYVDTERTLMDNKYNLKNILKILKKLRDNQKITNLRSYYIKTIFLWELEVQPQNFWNKSAGFILIHMCEILVKYLDSKNLPFFWDKSENMLAILTDEQISAMYRQFKSLTDKLKMYQEMNPVPDTFYKLFLDNNEIAAINCSSENCNNEIPAINCSSGNFVDNKTTNNPSDSSSCIIS